MHAMNGKDCSNKDDEEGDNNSEYSFYHITLHQKKTVRYLNVKGLDMNVLILDTATTITHVFNPMLLNDIHTVSPEIKVHCNTGTMINTIYWNVGKPIWNSKCDIHGH